MKIEPDLLLTSMMLSGTSSSTVVDKDKSGRLDGRSLAWSRAWAGDGAPHSGGKSCGLSGRLTLLTTRYTSEPLAVMDHAEDLHDTVWRDAIDALVADAVLASHQAARRPEMQAPHAREIGQRA